VPVERIPSEPLRPRALRVTLKADWGSLPAPRFWKGPPKLRLIGPLSVFDPEGVIVRFRLSLPLLIRCEPLKVCLRSLVASPDPPHAARLHARPAASVARTKRSPLLRSCI